jgi:hypothetical protein
VPAQAPGPDLVRAIGALLDEKASRTPAQRKLDSRLVYAGRMRRGLPAAAGIASLQTGVAIESDGRVLLDVRAEVSDALRERIESLGGRLVASVPSLGSLRVRLPFDAVETLASEPAVRTIRPADLAFTRKIDTSEGDGAHFASAARAAFGVDGTGVKVGVLSDGVSSLASLVASGDLPAGVTVLPGQAGSGSEGTAMLEIVHDLAPGASLLFATAFTSQASFASNIVALRNAGADVIVDDVGYFAEAVFQDDDVAAAVDQVVADGALYFSAAGNSGNVDDGTAGVWEGDFVPGASFHGHPAHDYGGGDIANEVTLDSPSAFTLHWSDPLGASANDYDLFLTNKTGNVIVAASTNIQSGSGDPFEIIGSGVNDKGRQLIIVRTAGLARMLHLNANRGQLEHATAGQLGGHPAARGATAVAAVDARGKTAGFTGSEPVEWYSSDGPRRVFYAANGSPYTPGNFSATGGELRGKPEITGADCVHTATPGFDPFCGTSAAAPHAAAIAALLIERAGGTGSADPASVLAALRSTTLDIEAPGIDRDAGSGIAHALAAAGAISTGCSGDPDCDDGVFCNGAETCSAGVCAPGTPPLCSGPTPYCDEGLDACVQCLTPAQCNDGLYCNGAESCSAGACAVGTPPACTGPTPYCNEGVDACVQCLTQAQCNDGLFCNGAETCSAGACTAGTPPACTGPTPYCDEGLAACVQCLSSAQCDDGLFCDGAETCSAGACTAGAPPVCSASTPLCDDSLASCVACLENSDCGSGLCQAGACAPPQVRALGASGRALLALALLGVGAAASLRGRRLPR